MYCEVLTGRENYVHLDVDVAKQEGIIQNAAERTPQFGRGIASDGERVQ